MQLLVYRIEVCSSVLVLGTAFSIWLLRLLDVAHRWCSSASLSGAGSTPEHISLWGICESYAGPWGNTLYSLIDWSNTGSTPDHIPWICDGYADPRQRRGTQIVQPAVLSYWVICANGVKTKRVEQHIVRDILTPLLGS